MTPSCPPTGGAAGRNRTSTRCLQNSSTAVMRQRHRDGPATVPFGRGEPIQSTPTGTPRGIRTPTALVLSQSPLPIGLEGRRVDNSEGLPPKAVGTYTFFHSVAEGGIEPTRFLFMRQASVPTLLHSVDGSSMVGSPTTARSGRQDSNLRGPGSKPGGLTATPHPEEEFPRRRGPATKRRGSLRLPRKDSNLHRVVNSHLSYLWTTWQQTES